MTTDDKPTPETNQEDVETIRRELKGFGDPVPLYRASRR